MKLSSYIGYKFYAVQQLTTNRDIGFELVLYIINKNSGVSKYGNSSGVWNNWQHDDFKNRTRIHKFIVGKPSKQQLGKLTDLQLDSLLIPPY